ncbi:unnamed protein product, partial [Pylaiella littoralis]
PSHSHGQHDYLHPPARTAAVDAATLVSARLLRKNAWTNAAALGLTIAVAACLLSGLALAAYAGLLPWRDMFPYNGEVFDATNDCRKVLTGSGASCGSPWSSPCFDRSPSSRGGGGSGSGHFLSVYVHDDTCSMKKSSEIAAGYRGIAEPLPWRQAAKAVRRIASERQDVHTYHVEKNRSSNRGVLVETPDEACIIFYAVPESGECVSKTPTWRDGQNHVLLDFNDRGRESRRSLLGKAMFAQSNMRPCYFRHGYDIAVPLQAQKLFYGLRKFPPQDRKYFATFKARNLYLTGSGMPERSAVRQFPQNHTPTDNNSDNNNDNDSKSSGSTNAKNGKLPFPDVVVVERCHDLHNEQLLSWNKELCESSRKEYDRASYGDLMNTTFALLPAGRSPATYRLGEALSAGALPVFIHQDFVKPFPDKIPWSEFSFSFPADEASNVINTLRAVPEKRLAQMQETALKVFDEFFGRGMEGSLRTTLDILEDRLSFRA